MSPHFCGSPLGKLGTSKTLRWYLNNRTLGENDWDGELSLTKLVPTLLLLLVVNRDGRGVRPRDRTLRSRLPRLLDLAHLLRSTNCFPIATLRGHLLRRLLRRVSIEWLNRLLGWSHNQVSRLTLAHGRGRCLLIERFLQTVNLVSFKLWRRKRELAACVFLPIFGYF